MTEFNIYFELEKPYDQVLSSLLDSQRRKHIVDIVAKHIQDIIGQELHNQVSRVTNPSNLAIDITREIKNEQNT